jgi:hypothetical protein
MIQNGFVYMPEAAPWLAEYLHEMTVFAKGKHDDQVDSTAQFLDWFNRPFLNQGFYEFVRMQAERDRNPQKERERHRVLLEGPICEGKPPVGDPLARPQGYRTEGLFVRFVSQLSLNLLPSTPRQRLRDIPGPYTA